MNVIDSYFADTEPSAGYSGADVYDPMTYAQQPVYQDQFGRAIVQQDPNDFIRYDSPLPVQPAAPSSYQPEYIYQPVQPAYPTELSAYDVPAPTVKPDPVSFLPAVTVPIVNLLDPAANKPFDPIAWAKENPLLLGAGALGVWFLLSKKKKQRRKKR